MYELNDKIKDLKPYEPIADEFKIRLDANESFIKLSDNMLNEIGAVVERISYNRYPDPLAGDVCKAFADLYNIPAEFVTAGNGSDELISVIFNGFLKKGNKFATLSHDFSMYNFYGYISEGNHIEIPKNSDFTIDIDRVIETCKNEDIKLLIFSNPCNPTSIVLPKEDVKKIVDGVSGLVVLDEAYMEFADESLISDIKNYDNLVILKTCSKAIGAAAIRLGFTIANERITTAIRAVKSPYNVNSATQEIGRIILSDKKYIDSAREEILCKKEVLRKELLRIEKLTGKFTLLNSSTNFFSLVMDNGEKLVNFLAKSGIAVRNTAGLVRITCGTESENKALIKAIEEYLKEV